MTSNNTQEQKDFDDILPRVTPTPPNTPMNYPPLDNSIYDDEYKKLPESFTDKSNRASILLDLVNQLRTGKDVWRISLPCQLLAPSSMLEYMSYFVTPNEYILTSWKKMIPEQRFLDVVKWWISNVAKAPSKGIFHSKPYNPALGEVFCCQFKHFDNSTSYYIAEQISHHPPISAFYLTNRKSNFVCKATFLPKIKFHGNSASNVMEGPLKCYFTNLNEEYIIKFPHFSANGLLIGSQKIDVNHIMTIECPKHGYKCEITFKSNSVKGRVSENGKKIYKLKGSLDDKIFAKDIISYKKEKKENKDKKKKRDKVSSPIQSNNQNETNPNDSKNEFLFFDATILKHPKMICRPLEKQAPLESRRLWHSLTYHLKKELDYSLSNASKKEIEEEQRKIRNNYSSSWKPRYFTQASTITIESNDENNSDISDSTSDTEKNNNSEKKEYKEKVPEFKCKYENMTAFKQDECDFSENDPIFDMDKDLSKGLN